MAQEKVRISKDGFEALVMPSSVKAYERHGWTRADDGSSESEKAETKAPAKKAATKKAASSSEGGAS